jgi:formylglycine-generating enzyme required for sulfatase activity
MKCFGLRDGYADLTLIVLCVAAVLAGCGEDDAVGPDPEPYVPPDDFVLIPADTFLMGGGAVHTVILTAPFYMSATEMTNRRFADLAQWAYDNGYCTATGGGIVDALDGSTALLMNFGSGGCDISFAADTFAVTPGRDEHPVRCASWFGAAACCDWLSLREGLRRAYDHSTWQCNDGDPYDARGFRLPTEAEWEHACRAGTRTVFNTGDCLDSATEANYNGTQPYTGCPAGPYEGDIVPVGSYLPNGFGLYDMHGNLWEWCNDWYADYPGGDETDPVGPLDGETRIVRGGAWGYQASHCTSAIRSWNPPSDSIWLLGFRPVASKR